MGVVVELCITAHVDNVEAIFLSENTSVSQQTKHIDVCRHFICDYVEDRTEKIQFFRSIPKMADPSFTKTLSNGPFQLLTSSYIHCE